MNIKSPLVKVRILIGIFIVALLTAGFTAFPLESEIRFLCKLLNISIEEPGLNEGVLSYWLALVAQGLIATNQAYPFLAYGFDWMAFAHIIIGVLFIGPFIDPVKNIWIIYWGMFACIALIPTALICGVVREIPFFWQLIDCSFGIFGIIPLLLCLKYIRQLSANKTE